MSNAERKRTARKASRSRSKPPKTTMRERVHNLTLKALRDHDMTLGDIPRFAQELIEGAAAGLNKAVPASSQNVLRQVVDGLTDAAKATVDSTKSVVTATTKRGAKFVKHDAVRTVKDLQNIEDEFVTALGRAGKKLKGAAKDELDAIVQQSRRAGTRIKPAAQNVLKAADGHLLELGKETAGASARIARGAVISVLQGASGLLQGLGEVLDPGKARPADKKSAK